MTKEITKANILQAIQDKFKLREFEPEKFLFSEMVVPIYNIGPHLEHWKIRKIEQPITSASNMFFFIVPENEKWTLNRYDVVFMGSGYSVAGVNLKRIDGDPDTIYLDLAAAQTVSYHIELSNPVTLVSNDKLYVNVDGYTSGSSGLRLYIDYKMEEIR